MTTTTETLQARMRRADSHSVRTPCEHRLSIPDHFRLLAVSLQNRLIKPTVRLS